LRLPSRWRRSAGSGNFVSFLRGNRVDQLRSGDFNVAQALRLMNNPFVLDRIQVGAERLKLSDDQLVDELFLSVLSRPATTTEVYGHETQRIRTLPTALSPTASGLLFAALLQPPRLPARCGGYRRE